jgi:hypothetical protein
MEPIPSEVDEAFEILLEEIEEVVNKHFDALASAGSERNITDAKQILERAEKLSDYRQKVSAIRKEWRTLQIVSVEPPATPKHPQPKPQQPTPSGRLARGQRTPEEAFYLAILDSLVELGGSGPIASVIDRVHEKMKSRLKEPDLQVLKSTNMPRWRNTAMWARNNLKEEKLMKSDSPFGIWAITEAGKAWAKLEHDKKV